MFLDHVSAIQEKIAASSSASVKERITERDADLQLQADKQAQADKVKASDEALRAAHSKAQTYPQPQPFHRAALDRDPSPENVLAYRKFFGQDSLPKNYR